MGVKVIKLFILCISSCYLMAESFWDGPITFGVTSGDLYDMGIFFMMINFRSLYEQR